MGEPESPVEPEPPPESTSEAGVEADSEPSGFFTVEVLRQLLICVAGWMFAGMAVWILLLDPTPKGGSSGWSGWHGRDVLLTVIAAYCLLGMARYVWDILLFQWELRGRPALSPLAHNLGHGSWQMLACLVAVNAFALGPYGLGTDALGLNPVSIEWLAAGLVVGMLGGPAPLVAAIVFSRWIDFPFRLESRQIDFFAPRAGGQAQPWAAVAGMLLLVVVLGPCVEELLFRGVVYAGLRNDLGVWAAVPLSAVLFGVFHRDAGWTAVAFTTAMGVAFALLVEASGSLWPAMLAHMLINSKLIAAFIRPLREPAT